ncbi:MAG TPA: metalloregulator ArsR/SmtB family transcription factor [Pseudonocardia sp.]|uniref:ArsR/SmtB family transcription factor n=1 Tax=Pseudonocardia sp. TaxID=60912 RepID=UPI002B4AF9C0|nr:metalloregulator ArsR/SmtB family transcription factor [Pseudonocardia sp.]HLU59184.1 metalloregulator ArsR/SmtB family transcription factor [Pseudonocardia sp.]
MDAFTVLADPLRREVVEMLADGPVTAGEIAARFPVTRPAVSRHLRVLRESGLVASEVRGQHRVYTLRREGLVELDRWLDRFRPLAPVEAAPAGPAARLDALDTELHRGRRVRRRARTDTPGAHRGSA